MRKTMQLTFNKRYNTIHIFEPKYSTREVIIKADKICERNKVIIDKGAYAGTYFLSGVVATAYQPRPQTTSKGVHMFYYIPISQLEKES